MTQERSTGRLAGKVAIVTGGGTSGEIFGTGRAISEVFAREGAAVAVVDVDSKAADLTVTAIREAGGQALAIVADVTKEADCERSVRATLTSFGQLNILVNNVGLPNTTRRPRLADMTEEIWDRMMAVNVKGAWLMTKHSTAAMLTGGSVIHLSSTAAGRPGADAAYATAKGTVEHLSLAVASEYGEQGIRSNVIRPGEIWGSQIARAFPRAEWSGLRQKRIERSLLRSEGTAYDVAMTALYFACDDSRWVTGQSITVDGGVALRKDVSYKRDFKPLDAPAGA